MLLLSTYLLLGQVVRQVGNHDLVLGGDAIGRGSALTLLGGASLVLLVTGGLGLVSIDLVGNVAQRLNLFCSCLDGSGSGLLFSRGILISSILVNI